MDIKHLLALASACVFSINPLIAQAQASRPLDVGFVYVTPVTEAGWTAQHEAGRKQLQAALKESVKTRFVDKVAEGADAERVIRDLAATGSKLIFTTSFGFMEPTLKVAKEFPEVKFVHVSGYKTATNVANVNARFYEGRYIAGWLAGKHSKSAVAGYVAAFPIPEVLQGINAFTLGMKAANPKAQVKVIWTASWFDPSRETEAANTLIAQGADVLTHHTDSNAVALAAENKNVRVVSYHSNMAANAPKAQLVAVTHHWGDYYTTATKQAIAGSWKTSSVWGGAKAGMIKLEGFGKDVSKSVQAEAQSMLKAMANGKLHAFSGKILSNSNNTVHEKGAMTDAQLNEMNYLVQGVQGTIPK